jgi:hypothetical protein
MCLREKELTLLLKSAARVSAWYESTAAAR